MVKPEVIIGAYDGGIHNNDLAAAHERLKRAKSYRDLSTICVVPTRGSIPARVVEAWMALLVPMNQKFTRMFVAGVEVGDAYELAIEMILANPVLRDWKYVLTLEEDNMPPPDGLLKLYESMDDYDVVGGLYWTKGECGQPMIYGKPDDLIDFVPQLPEPDVVQPCNGLGQGFTLFRLDIFKDERIERPWFKTLQEVLPSGGTTGMTQDLYFFQKIRQLGYRVASDNRVHVGHHDVATGLTW